MARHNQCHFHSYLFTDCIFQIQNSLIGMPATYLFFLSLSHLAEYIWRSLILKISASPALWNAIYVTPKDDYWIEKGGGRKREKKRLYNFISLVSAMQQRQFDQNKHDWVEAKMSQPYSPNTLFKPLSCCPLSGTRHKGVRLAFARAVLFVFACLIVNLGSVHTAGWTGKSRHSCLLGIATMHWHTRGPAGL